MPRGVKGSGPYSKVGKQKPAAAATTRRRVDESLDELERSLAPDSREATCRVCKAVLQAGGQCVSCQARAAHFKDLIALEAAARQCEICRAPAPGRWRGRRLCTLCRDLERRQSKLKAQAARSTGVRR